MKKYIFTESQIKKIIDNQLNEELSTSNVVASSNGAVTSSISQVISDDPFYKQMVRNLRNESCTIFLVTGRPTKGNVLLTKNMTIQPTDMLTFRNGDSILVKSASVNQATISAENGKLVASIQGA
jgi:hydroxymethylpyrimidine pyrophosphatase-like HAD family hydrolase